MRVCVSRPVEQCQISTRFSPKNPKKQIKRPLALFEQNFAHPQSALSLTVQPCAVGRNGISLIPVFWLCTASCLVFF
eukprot:s985_g17.t1